MSVTHNLRYRQDLDISHPSAHGGLCIILFQVVVKQVDVSGMDRSARRAARREVMILSHLKHPNIIHHYESFEDAGKLCIVTEYAGASEEPL